MYLTMVYFVIICFTFQCCFGLNFQFLKKDFYSLQKYLDEDVLSIVIIYESEELEHEENVEEFVSMSVQRNVFAYKLIVDQK